MALSEREQELLDQIERGLGSSDQKLGTVLPPARARLGLRRSVLWAISGATLGMTLVLGGLVSNLVVVAVLGFLVIIGAVATARIMPQFLLAKRSRSTATRMTKPPRDGAR